LWFLHFAHRLHTFVTSPGIAAGTAQNPPWNDSGPWEIPSDGKFIFFGDGPFFLPEVGGKILCRRNLFFRAYRAGGAGKKPEFPIPAAINQKSLLEKAPVRF